MNDWVSAKAEEPLMRRRVFLGSSSGLGAIALSSLLGSNAFGAERSPPASRVGGLPDCPHFAPKAKRVIYLFQSGAPSQMDLFDPKPGLANQRGSELPDSIRKGQRLTGMTSRQASFPVAPTKFKFAQHGESGAWVSELLPHTAKMADNIAFIRSMHTEAINHDPAVTFFQTGNQLAGRPSMGAWVNYGLGTESTDLPAFVAMISSGLSDQPLYDRLWGSGFLPSKYQGIKFRSVGDPVLYLSNPDGLDAGTRRRMLDDLKTLNNIKLGQYQDPEIATRIEQYEMAYRMQTSVPELTDLSREPAHIFKLYGPDSKKPGTYAYNCLLARRLAERGVRFIQLFHRGWDQHTSLPKNIASQCRDVDQPSAALLADLKQRGMLDDTLVIWGGEFGRTVYCQGTLTADDYGRDHHPRCFTIWMAGGGIKPGVTWGETDEYSYNIVKDPVHIHDLHATMLHCLGVDHTRLTYKFQGRYYRLTDVHGNVVKGILA
ncbi:MAG: DUF1501 domain-containing protein [Planctomycetaceae bacterium]|nr:DUF1501 domain-containing protein [Planctomycetaceae bacterium]